MVVLMDDVMLVGEMAGGMVGVREPVGELVVRKVWVLAER
jgi:hypothetical protein